MKVLPLALLLRYSANTSSTEDGAFPFCKRDPKETCSRRYPALFSQKVFRDNESLRMGTLNMNWSFKPFFALQASRLQSGQTLPLGLLLKPLPTYSFSPVVTLHKLETFVAPSRYSNVSIVCANQHW
jgi:hypothetical protein